SAAACITSVGNSPDLSMPAARRATMSRANLPTCSLKASCSGVSSRIISSLRSLLYERVHHHKGHYGHKGSAVHVSFIVSLRVGRTPGIRIALRPVPADPRVRGLLV